MVGRKRNNIPKQQIQKTLEINLQNSETPSFAVSLQSQNSEKDDFSEKSENPEKEHQKRQNVFSPLKSLEPAKKRVKEEIKREKQKGFLGDYFWEIEENEKRIRTILQSNINYFQTYRALFTSSLKIPVPHTLLFDGKSPEASEKCSVEDRKKAILHVFSRRFGLQVCSETLHLGAALLDKCLDLMSVNRERLEELAAVTLVIASKIEDVDCLTTRSVIDMNLVDEKTSVKMISSLERFVLVSLDFQVTVSTPLNYATYMLVHLDAAPSTINLTYYLLELSLLYVHNRSFPSDVIAHAATCLAVSIEETDVGSDAKTILQKTRLKLTIFTENRDFSSEKEVIRTLMDLFIVAPEENHTIFREYSTFRRNYVANRRIDDDLQQVLKTDEI